MTPDRLPDDDLRRIGTERGRAPGLVAAAALLAVVAAAGLLGRFVPAPDASSGGDTTATRAPSAEIEAGVRLTSPIGNVVWLRATEVEVRGVLTNGIRAVDAAIRAEGQIMGEAVLEADSRGRIDGVVPIIPPAVRTTAILDLTEARPGGRPLAEVRISVEAGARLLIRSPSTLAGTAGAELVVDILVYDRLRTVRGLLTSQAGLLIASASARPGATGPADDAAPRMIALRLELPIDAPSGRARLHVLGIDAQGAEVEHIDANVQLTPRR